MSCTRYVNMVRDTSVRTSRSRRCGKSKLYKAVVLKRTGKGGPSPHLQKRSRVHANRVGRLCEIRVLHSE
jgi:hypothetical protein